MSTYDKIAWLPLCGGLTGLGLVLSYLVMRRRGLGVGPARGGLVAAAAGRVPDRRDRDVLEDGRRHRGLREGLRVLAQVWSGIAVAGLAALLFVVSGPLRRRGKRGQEPAGRRRPAPRAPDAAGREIAPRTAPAAATASAEAPVKARKGKNAADDDDDLGDVEDILRRHGIT